MRSIKPPMAMEKTFSKKSLDRSWRPNQFKRSTQTRDLATVSLGTAWHWEILVHMKWADSPEFAWSHNDYATAEAAMEAADKAMVAARKTSSKEEFAKLFPRST